MRLTGIQTEYAEFRPIHSCNHAVTDQKRAFASADLVCKRGVKSVKAGGIRHGVGFPGALFYRPAWQVPHAYKRFPLAGFGWASMSAKTTAHFPIGFAEPLYLSAHREAIP